VDVVFLDANVLFSAAYRVDAGVRGLWKLPETRLVTSSYAAEEARRNLEPSLRMDLETLLATVELVADVAPDVKTTSIELAEPGLPDKDIPILLAAIGAGATYLLTGDFKHFGSYYGKSIEGVLVMPPADYLRSRVPEDL
jgi:predicted nucleic acid-binding protein